MENKENEGLGAQEPEKEESTSPPPKKGIEEKMDEVADKFSKTMSEGVKRMETAFQNVKDDAETRKKVKGFFTSSTGGAVLVVVGVLWFFYAVGLFNQPIFPIILIVIGAYLMFRYKSD
ncbi:MAG: hypothetical protein JSW50_03730 [Candidatus Latescibacterota bacterium]|nr:MAG: hypothetical protein JSW50_03730 [Candidatus Latescibacterota bacterium]